MKIKPLIRGGKSHLTNWIINSFPKEYETMSYVEPFIGGGNVFLNKNTCKEEVINDSNLDIIQIWQSLRDESKSFLNKLKKIEYKEKVFKYFQNKKTKNYFENAIKEFVLRKMSKNELKKNYCSKNSKNWKNTLENLEKISQKIQKNTSIFNKNAIEIIKYFNDENSLIYCEPPDLETSNKNKISTDQHILLADALNASHGKILISAKNSSLYRKLYVNWKMCKHTSKKTECIWINF